MTLRNAAAGATVIIVVAILAVLVLPEREGGGGPGPGGRAADARPEAAPPVEGGAAAGGGVRESLPAAAAAEELQDFLGWRGVVLDAAGAPVPGARVLAWSGSRRSAAVCGADGRFALPWPVAAAWTHGSVWAEWRGLAGTAFPQPPARPPAELTLQLRAGIPVRFTVLDKRTELPVAGVPVGIEGAGWISTGVTGADGAADLQAGKAGSCYGVIHPTSRVSADDVVQRFIEAGSAGESIVMRVAVFPGHVALLARDRASGLVVESAVFRRVARSGASWSLGERLPGIRGGLDVEVAPADRPLIVRVDAEGYLPREVYPAEASDGVVMVDLERARGVPVQVVRQGRPTGPATLHWSMPAPLLVWPGDPQPDGPDVPWREARQARSQLEGSTTTAADGRAELPYLGTPAAAPPHFSLRIAGPEGVQRDFGELRTEALGDQALGWVFELEPGRASVVVTVAGAGGGPRGGVPVRVSVRAPDSDDPAFRARALTSSELEERTGTGGSGRTGVQGEARFELLAPGTLYWTVGSGVSALRGSDPRPLEAGEERRVHVTAPVGGLSLAGAVVETSGAPLREDWMQVVARPAQLERQAAPGTAALAPVVHRYTGRVAEDGTFRIPDMLPGLYLVHVESVVDLSEPVEVAAGVQDLRIRLLPRRDVQVTVVDAATGVGLAGAEVSLHDARSLTTWSTETGPDGGAVFEGLSPDFTQVLATAPGYAAWGRDLAGLPGEDLLRLRAELRPGRQLQVRLEFPEEEQAVQRVVRGDLPRADARQHAVRFVRGTLLCTLRSAPRTDFTLLALDAAGEPVGQPLRIPPGEEPLQRVWVLR